MVTRLDRLARRPATCRTPSPLSPTRKRIVPRSGSTGRSPWQVGKPTIPRVGLARLEPRRAAARCYKQWLAPILTFRFSNRQRQRFFLLVLTVRCCRSLPPRCYVTVLCFSNTVLQLCLAVSHVCLCGRRHLKPTIRFRRWAAFRVLRTGRGSLPVAAPQQSCRYRARAVATACGIRG